MTRKVGRSSGHSDTYVNTQAYKHYMQRLEMGWEGRVVVLGVVANSKTLLDDIRPPANATADYAIGLEKLSANEQVFVGADNYGSKFVTDN